MSRMKKNIQKKPNEEALEAETDKKLTVRGNFQVNIGLDISQLRKMPRRQKLLIVSMLFLITVSLIIIVAFTDTEFAKDILSVLEKLLALTQLLTASFGIVNKQVQ